MSPIDLPLRRVERAWQHYGELDQAIIAFFETDPYPITREDDPKRGGYRYRVAIKGAVPPSIGLIFGDFVHNLRSALDNLVYEVARAHTRNPRDTHWPFSTSRKRFEELAMLRQLPPRAVEIIERYQPYHVVGHEPWKLRYLQTLNTFWNGDKHRATIPAAQTSESSYLAGYGDADLRFESYFGPIYNGKIVGWMPADLTAQRDDPHFPISIAFRRNPIVLFFPHVMGLHAIVKDILLDEDWDSACKPTASP
jgi:hypothetical protein